MLKDTRHGEHFNMAVSSDLKKIALCYAESIFIIDSETGTIIKSFSPTIIGEQGTVLTNYQVIRARWLNNDQTIFF